MKISLIYTLALVALSGLAQGSTAERTPNTRPITSPESATEILSGDSLQIETQFMLEIESLLNWAKFLSGITRDAAIPEVRFETIRFFVDNACGGRDDWRVIGWYDDRKIIHIDDRVRTLDSLFNRSPVVHELVHYLQHVSGRYTDSGCEGYVQREREAYAAQQQFFIAYGAMPGIQTHYFSCNKLDTREVVLAHGL